jgi:hypothetical protein
MLNPTGAQQLPPKMGASFVELAKAGKADLVSGAGNTQIYQFFRGNQIITLVGLRPEGHVRKAKPGEIDRLKAEASKVKAAQ